VRLLWRQLAGELHKLFARKRTYIGFGAFLAVELLLLFLLRLDRIQRSMQRLIEQSGYAAAEYLSGLTLALMILMWTVFFLGGLYIALVAGDVVGKEVEDGTMRMILCRPISRFRVLLLKMISCGVYTAALAVFISVTALLTGLIAEGPGGLFVYSPFESIFALHAAGAGLVRYALAVPFLALSLFSIAALGFFFSCLDIKPAAATILTLSIFFIDLIVKNIPYFESIREWFFTARLASWIHIFEYRIPWAALLENYSWIIAVDCTLFVLAWLIFEQRDFKS
jgi:ABC-2 type transport system permease protein